jgi:hypothetical protein
MKMLNKMNQVNKKKVKMDDIVKTLTDEVDI